MAADIVARCIMCGMPLSIAMKGKVCEFCRSDHARDQAKKRFGHKSTDIKDEFEDAQELVHIIGRRP